MILITLMGARIPSGFGNFKRVIKYQTLGTSFYGGFEPVANRLIWVEIHLKWSDCSNNSGQLTISLSR